MPELTRDNIKALRNADTAVFRWKQGDPDAHVIDLTKEVERGDGFGKDTKRVTIPAPARVSNYGQGYISKEAENMLPRAIAGDWVLLSLVVRSEWYTFASFVRPGDALEQEWVVDNRSEATARRHTTMHELKVRVVRPAKDSRVKVYTFILDAHSEPDSGYSSAITRDPNFTP